MAKRKAPAVAVGKNPFDLLPQTRDKFLLFLLALAGRGTPVRLAAAGRRWFSIALLTPSLTLDSAWMASLGARSRWLAVGESARSVGLSWCGFDDLSRFEDRFCSRCQGEHEIECFDEDGACLLAAFEELPVIEPEMTDKEE